MKTILANTINLSVSNSLQIFDTKVLPILLYGAELWGYKPHNSIVRVYDKFHKYLLGLTCRTVSTVALGELGRPSFKYYSVQKMISGWLRLLMHNEDRYTKICYKEQFAMAENNINCWGAEIKYILYSTGFNHVWDNQGVGNVNAFLSTFKQRLLDIDRQSWATGLHSFNSLRTYILLKDESFVEPYVWILNNFSLRRSIARLRCASLEIEVNEGRIHNKSYDQRICKHCSSNEIDDELHFLFRCPFLTHLRIRYIPYYYRNYPSVHKLVSLLNTDNEKLFISLG